MTTATIDPTRLEAFIGKMLGDFGAVASAPLVLLGDQLGLFAALAEHGPLTSPQLAERTATSERYIREWLAAMAASGYVDYDEQAEAFSLSAEQAAVLVDPDSPMLMTGGYYSMAAVYNDTPALAEAFRSGDGIGWENHNGCLFCGTEKFFRPSYKTNLVSAWLPALEGVVAKLEAGCRVADVGCGHGASTLIMAEAFPNSTFIGFDIHPPSIEHARNLAAEAGLTNLRFEVATAKDYPGEYDFIAFFDCLHDMGDPAGAAAHAHRALRPGGTWMVVEPRAGDTLAENMNPVSRIYYAFSTTVCTPCSLAQEVGAALGAQAGEARLREVIGAGGFEAIRVAVESPFNLVLEARR